MDGYTVVVTKSTVPVGTGDEVERIIGETRPGAAFAVASNPEFLREGAAIADFKRPDRIVIGSDDEWARHVLTEVYRPLFLDVSRGIGLDGRIGPKFLHAGPGYGGSCFPKDTLALLKTAEDFDSPTRIV